MFTPTIHRMCVLDPVDFSEGERGLRGAPAATAFETTHMEHLEDCHPLTGAAPTALTVVHRGVEAIVVSRQIKVNTCITE